MRSTSNSTGPKRLTAAKGGKTKERKTHPAKKADTAKVAYKAELEFEFTVESTRPAAPRPLRALNDPGHMKQTRPRRHTWVTGL